MNEETLKEKIKHFDALKQEKILHVAKEIDGKELSDEFVKAVSETYNVSIEFVYEVNKLIES